MTQLPQLAPFRAPALVSLVMSELAEDDLSYGVEVDAVYAALVASRAAIDPCRAVLAMLVCGDFATLPRLAAPRRCRVAAAKKRASRHRGSGVVGRKYYRISSQSNLLFRYLTIRLQLLPEV